jgi:hypothetical protein
VTDQRHPPGGIASIIDAVRELIARTHPVRLVLLASIALALAVIWREGDRAFPPALHGWWAPALLGLSVALGLVVMALERLIRSSVEAMQVRMTELEAALAQCRDDCRRRDETVAAMLRAMDRAGMHTRPSELEDD